jgi:hypothetical protein
MKKDMPARDARKFLSPMKNIDVMRIYYCYQIGSTFVQLGFMERKIIHAMAMCDRIKLLGKEAPAFHNIVERHAQLTSSTLGNLIIILSKHTIQQADLDYLKWVKTKRDFFVHRFFVNEDWPGDRSEQQIRLLCRQLLYLEHIFNRAHTRIWKILGRANLMEYHDLGQDGAMVMNPATREEDAWFTELAIAAIRDRASRQRGR